MRTIAEYKDRYAGRRFVIVGKGPTRFQYENLGETDDPIIFINDAVQFDDPTLPSVETFFFAHDPCQAIWLTSELKATAALPLRDSVDSAGAPMLSIAALGEALQVPHVVTYNWARWWHEHRNTGDVLAEAARDRNRLERSGVLFLATGTIHSAIHFAWWCGASQLTFVGCDGFCPDAAHPYDSRIACQSKGEARSMFGKIRRDQDWLCDVLGLPTEYVNERHLANVIPARAHTVWFGESVPDWVAGNVAQFRVLHPGWEVALWCRPPDDMPADLLRLMADLPQICTQKDVLSYWLLNHYGGMFFDADVVPLRSFEPLRRYDTFLARDPSGRCNCAVMGAAPGAAGATRLLARVRELAAAGEGPNGQRTTFGPRMLTELFGRVGEERNVADVDVLPLHYFYLFCDQKEAHHWWKGNAATKQQCFDARMAAMTDDIPPYAIHLWGVDGSSHQTARGHRDALLYRLSSLFGPRAPIVGAEVGVLAGKLSCCLLAGLPGLHLHMVDAWRGGQDGESGPGGGIGGARDKATAEACTRQYGARRTILHGDSVAMAELVEDGALDFVFIDGDHRYRAVLADLAAWYPKLRRGGLLCGHDYENPVGIVDGVQRWGVKRAVAEFMAAADLLGEPELGAGTTWFVETPT